MSKGFNVRLSQESHMLLAEKAKKLGIPMKELASEAILVLFKKKEAKVNEDKAKIARLQSELRWQVKATRAAFVLGIVVSAIACFLVSVLL